MERQVAKILTQWWGEGEFHRTPASGALHWKDDHRVSGDIVSPDQSTFFFSVECKNHQVVSLEKIILNSSDFISFWEQCKNDAVEFNKVPMLVVKRDRMKPWVIIPYRKEIFVQMGSANHPVFITFLDANKVICLKLSDLVTINKTDMIDYYRS